MKKILLASILLVGMGLSAFAKDIYVKYRGTVDVSNGYFQHLSLKSSSFINDMYYDSSNNYLLVQLNSTYYHYCGIPQGVVSDWKYSSSLGRYYNSNIKGHYDCRVNPVPEY